MEKFKRLNNIGGFVTFLIAAVVYTLTLEPTASWWDVGEYIATAFKLQVGHPPGAPLFQMLGRFFSLFAFGNEANVAYMINFMSGIVSALTVMFLFWTITHLVKKLVSSQEKDGNSLVIILASGFIGSMAYAFTDSFWFSAVEGEVYAMSSFFTAVVFWAILKWEEQVHEKHSIRWIIFIAYLVGLSIGVHLLNLLAIPAIAYVIYFKKYNVVSWKGIAFTGVLSFIVLAVIMYILIPGVVSLAAKFELLFVNTFGLPFNTGTIIYFLLVTGGLTYGIIWSQKKRKFLANTIILSLTFILIGYSSFMMLVIRANANTPINENNPDDAISLLSYLNREQYGTWPIFTGQYYNSPADLQNPGLDGSPVYVRDKSKGRYVITDDRKNTLTNYDSRFTTIFPRMYSSQASHVRAYKSWGKIKGRAITIINQEGQSEVIYKPTFTENLRFFFSYQLGHMYFRYFMWNFAGRQNDIQGHGGITNGNWLSGINALDEMRLGNQDDLPESMKSPARNTYFLLPLILGVIGMLGHFSRNYKDGIVVALLFFMTGIAIVLYLNQTPFQPRERDYAYAGSFYAFAIWLGIGVYAIYDGLKKRMSSKVALPIAAILTLTVPVILLAENYDDHDRSNKYAARDWAINYLNSVDKNAILITNGDNDTFPLWYAQEVEGIRTDVRVVNYMLSSGDWYVHQLARKIYDSEPLDFQLSPEQYNKGVNEFIPVYDRGLPRTELKLIMNFIESDSPESKVSMISGESANYIPTRKVRLTVDKEAVIKNDIVPTYMQDSIVPHIDWDIDANYLFKNDLMLLDFLANNNWKRPLYFASPASISKVLNIDRFCHLTGVVYKFIPVLAEDYLEGLGGVDTEASYRILMNAQWGNLNHPDVVVDPESHRNALMAKQNYIRLAQALVNKGKNVEAIAVADKLIEQFPNEKFPFDLYITPIAEVYYAADADEKAIDFVKALVKVYGEKLRYYNQMSPQFSAYYAEDSQEAMIIIARLFAISLDNGQDKVVEELESQYMLPADLKNMYRQ